MTALPSIESLIARLKAHGIALPPGRVPDESMPVICSVFELLHVVPPPKGEWLTLDHTVQR